ncbi:MAG: 2-phosphosulfolactate phosphatase [Candidatus Promineifilaceae bacterium]
MFNIRCEWGPNGARKLAEECELTIIVDVISFSTSVDIAVSRSIQVLPYSGPADLVDQYAERHNALAASRRGTGIVSLSPASFAKMEYVERVVLPSPNGSTLTLMAAGSSDVYCGCIRNASAVAAAAAAYRTIGVVPAGEKWPDGSLRPALEDWLGAGAIISRLSGLWSPEAAAAVSAFELHKNNLRETFESIPSGVELLEIGFQEDVSLAAEYDVSSSVPRFRRTGYH